MHVGARVLLGWRRSHFIGVRRVDHVTVVTFLCERRVEPELNLPSRFGPRLAHSTAMEDPLFTEDTKASPTIPDVRLHNHRTQRLRNFSNRQP